MRKHSMIFLLFCLCRLTATAQQDPQFSQYMFNSLIINPAYAGYKEELNVSLLHRNQWVGLPGSPKSQTIIIDGAFFSNNNVGLGLSIINDKIGLQSQTAAYANYSYRVPMGENSRLAFGLALGVSKYSLNASGANIDDPNDPNFMNGNQNYMAPDGKFGIHFSNEKLYAGASVTNLISESLNYQRTGKDVIARQGKHFFLTAGYLANITENVKFKPSIMFREDTKGPTNLDLNAFFLFKDAVWVGASYRSGLNLWTKADMEATTFKKNAVVGMVEMYFAKNYRLGYAYDYSLSALGDYTNGTHEISLGFVINNNKKVTAMPTPRYF
ncbi:MAG: type IX secretion system membrane protein PorP/SprF [Flavobacterium sp.]|nr:type IX secretion system membrane protein PorP/SprF [Pedobacter sp.]